MRAMRAGRINQQRCAKPGCFALMTKHTLSRWRTADIAHADKQYGKTAHDSALHHPERQAGIVAQKRGMNNTATALQQRQRSNRQH
jgi:hypothetical protein